MKTVTVYAHLNPFDLLPFEEVLERRQDLNQYAAHAAQHLPPGEYGGWGAPPSMIDGRWPDCAIDHEEAVRMYQCHDYWWLVVVRQH